MGTIPFVEPAQFLLRIKLGEIQRFGAILKDADSGRIVGHLQEAGRFSANLSGGMNPFVQAGQLLSSVAANVQLEQVKHMLSTLQLLTGASLAASAIGLGVSVAGFVVVSRKLHQLGHQLGQIEAALTELRSDVQAIDRHQRAKDRAAMISIMDRGEEAWTRRDKEQVWRDLADKLSFEASYYRALLEIDRPRGESIINDNAVSWHDVIAGHETLAHLVAARTKCLLLLNELEAALHHASTWCEWLRRNFRDLTPPTIVDKRTLGHPLRREDNPEQLRLEMLDQAYDFIRIVRAQQDFAISEPELIKTMIHRGINGREYIEQLRDNASDLLVFETPS